MCSHPDHEVTTLPDGQVDETHVFSTEDLQAIRLAAAVDRMVWAMSTAHAAHAFPLTIGAA